MAKSRRNNYHGAGRDLWAKDRPLSWTPSSKWSKTKSHRIERAWVHESIHRELVQLGYR